MTDYKELRDALTSDFSPVYTDLYGDQHFGGDYSRAGLSKAQDSFIAAAKPETIRALLSELDSLREDAERYRHIKPMFRVFSLNISGMHSYCPTGELAKMRGYSFDAAIDSARNTAKEGKE